MRLAVLGAVLAGGLTPQPTRPDEPSPTSVIGPTFSVLVGTNAGPVDYLLGIRSTVEIMFPTEDLASPWRLLAGARVTFSASPFAPSTGFGEWLRTIDLAPSVSIEREFGTGHKLYGVFGAGLSHFFYFDHAETTYPTDVFGFSINAAVGARVKLIPHAFLMIEFQLSLYNMNHGSFFAGLPMVGVSYQ
jgi:hypothetical protein